MLGMHIEAPRNRLREILRTRQDVRLIDVAALCRVDQSTAFRWQDGEIPRRHLPAIAHLLGVSVPYLDGWVDDPMDDPNGEPAEAAA
jgi:hypothetical protein